MATIPTLIDLAELKLRSGDTSFAKGLTLAHQERVSQLECQDGVISATVQGTRPYKVKLRLNKRGIDCSCTCPAAEYQEVCKHGVATALAFTMQTGLQAGTGDEEESERELLRRYFDRQDKESLLALLLDELGNDDNRWRYWLGKARLSEQNVTPAALKKLINRALPRESLWDWREVADYFEQAELLFGSVWEGLARLPVQAQWALLIHAIERLNLVLTKIDDSNGERFGIENELIARIPALFPQLAWSDEQRAAWLFEHLIETPLDIFPSLSNFGVDKCSPALLVLCEQGLETLLNTPGDEQKKKWDARRYSAPLLAAAKARGDWRTELAILSRLAERTHDWLTLCDLCLEHQEPLDAEFWLVRARKQASSLFEQHTCDRLAIRICEQRNDKAQAWRLANQLFEQSPSFEEYQRLHQLQQRLAWQDEGLLSRVETALKAVRAPASMGYANSGQEALIRFYLEQGREDDACDWVDDHQVNRQTLLALAERVLSRRPQDALAYHFRAAAATVVEGNNGAYLEAVAQLRKLAEALAGNAPMLVLFNQHLNALTTEYRRKRNFIKLVDQHFSNRAG